LAKRQSIAGTPQPYGGLRATRKSSISSSSTAAPARPTAASTTSSSATTKSKDPRVQTLETENTHLKKQNAHIQEQLTTANQAKVERDRFEAIVQKLQAKCQNYHQEHVELKAVIRQKETELDAANKEIEYNETNHEMAVLDKETAELKFEQMEAERDALEHQIEVIKLELEIAEEQVAMFNEDLPPEQRSAAASSIVQKENERLRNTIRRMHEDTEDLKREYTRRIDELEKAAGDTDALREEISMLHERDAARNSTIEDLLDRVREQEEWEDVVEGLSDQNQQLQEQAVQKDATIEQYVTLKELSDEVEAQLVDRVHELLDEHDAKDLELADCHRQIHEDAAVKTDQSLLIEKLRQFIVDTQSSMSQVETMKTMSDEHVVKMTERFNEAMEMNRAMRNARINDISKTIDTELTKQDAVLAREELHILKYYLPDSVSATFTHTSMLAYFQAKKIASGASLVRSQLVVVDVANPQGLDQAISDLYRCDAAYEFEQIQYSAEYLHANARRCSMDQFRMIGDSYAPMSGIEAMIQRTLTCFKQDDINLRNLAESARTHAGNMHSASRVVEIGPDCVLIEKASLIRANLDRNQGYFEAVRTAFLSAGLKDAYDGLMALPNLAKECHAVGVKLLQVLTALQNDNLYPLFEHGEKELDTMFFEVEGLAKTTRRMAQAFIEYLANEEAKPFATDAVVENYERIVNTQYAEYDAGTKMKEIRSQLAQWTEYASVLMNTAEVESFTPPWELKARDIEAKKKTMLDAEKKLAILTAEHQAAIIQMLEREQIIETKALEIEHLKAKNKDFFAKHEEHNRLAGEWRAAMLELAELRVKVKEQSREIDDLKDARQHVRFPERVAVSDLEEKPATEVPAPKTNSSSSFITFVQALSDENHWLRQRENSEMFGHNLGVMFSRMGNDQAAQTRTHSRRRQVQASEMLDMVLSMHSPAIPETTRRLSALHDSDFRSESWTPDLKSMPTPHDQIRATSTKSYREPLQLSAFQASFRSDLPVEYLEDYCFNDLSIIAEEFDELEELGGFGDIVVDV
jgi:dynactin 1